MRQAAVGADDLDAIHAHVKHLGLHAHTLGEHLLGQHLVVDIVAAQQPGRASVKRRLGQESAPAIFPTVVQQAVVVAKRLLRRERGLPLLGGLPLVLRVQARQPAGVLQIDECQAGKLLPGLVKKTGARAVIHVEPGGLGQQLQRRGERVQRYIVATPWLQRLALGRDQGVGATQQSGGSAVFDVHFHNGSLGVSRDNGGLLA